MKSEDFARKPIVNSNEKRSSGLSGHTATSGLGGHTATVSASSATGHTNMNTTFTMGDDDGALTTTTGDAHTTLTTTTTDGGPTTTTDALTTTDGLTLSSTDGGPTTTAHTNDDTLTSATLTSKHDNSLTSNTTSNYSFHQVRSQPIMSTTSSVNRFGIRHQTPPHGIGITTNHGIPTNHGISSNHAISTNHGISINHGIPYNNGGVVVPLNDSLSSSIPLVKTGLRLRRQSSYTSTNTNTSTPSGSFIPTPSNPLPISFSSGVGASGGIPTTSITNTINLIPFNMASEESGDENSSTSPTAGYSSSLSIAQSPSTSTTWSSSRIGIKKKNSINAIHGGPSAWSSPPPCSSNGSNENGIEGNVAMSPAASFMMAFNNAATFSTGSLDSGKEEEYGVGDEIGEYTLIKELGRGAFSIVFEAVTPVAPLCIEIDGAGSLLKDKVSTSTATPSKSVDGQNAISSHSSGMLYSVAVKVVMKTKQDDQSAENSNSSLPLVQSPFNSSNGRGDRKSYDYNGGNFKHTQRQQQRHHTQPLPNLIPAPTTSQTKDEELDYLRQIDRETAIWSRLHHPSILEMKEVIRLDDATIIISELAAGGTLLEFVQRQGTSRGGGLEEEVAKGIFREIGAAIEYLHVQVGIIHHDVKLENVLMTSDGRVKLCDFGFAVESGGARKYGDGNGHGEGCPGLCCAGKGGVGETLHLSLGRRGGEEGGGGTGSLHYLAPEHLMPPTIASGGSAIFLPQGEKGDIWAFGCILFAMLTGSLPFCDSFLPRLQMSILNASYDKSRLAGKASSEACDLVGVMLERDWKRRASITECLKSAWLRSVRPPRDR